MNQTANAIEDYWEDDDLPRLQIERMTPINVGGMSQMAKAHLNALELSRSIHVAGKLSGDRIHYYYSTIENDCYFRTIENDRVANEFFAWKLQQMTIPQSEGEIGSEARALRTLRLIANATIALATIGVLISAVWIGISVGSGSAEGLANAVTAQLLTALAGLLAFSLARSVRHIIKKLDSGQGRLHYGARFAEAAE